MTGAPFPYFGGKARVASEVWRRFGSPTHYLEPFAGSAAIALANPAPDVLKLEIVNDLNCYLSNFWRSVALHPDRVAVAADWPVIQVDLYSRHEWLINRHNELLALMRSDINACDPEAAGVWVWGLSQWVGSGWCGTNHSNRRPHIGHEGMGTHSIGQRPHVGGSSGGFYDTFRALAQRLRHTRITCCDWRSVLSPVCSRNGSWGVFLDPPYTAESGRCATLYESQDDTEGLSIGHEVAVWAFEKAAPTGARIALCGIAGEYDVPSDWEAFAWKTSGYGYGGRDREELIWFSPSCRRQRTLFSMCDAKGVREVAGVCGV